MRGHEDCLQYLWHLGFGVGSGLGFAQDPEKGQRAVNILLGFRDSRFQDKYKF